MLDEEMCLCLRCVRFCKDITKTAELECSFKNRPLCNWYISEVNL